MTEATMAASRGAHTVLPIDSIRIGRRYRRRLGDVEALARSIASVGLLHPVVVTPDRRLVAGLRRLEALKSLGRDAVPARIVDVADLLSAERDENEVRQNFAPSEAVAIGRAIQEREREAAKARQGTRTDLQPCGKLPRSSGTKTRDKAGRAVGLSGRTFEKAQAVVEAAEADPDAFGDLPERMDRTGKVDPTYKELRRRRREQRKSRRVDLPDSEACRLICCDIAGAARHVEAESVDWIITDPPYPKQYLPLFGSLGAFAEHALKDGGSLICMSGQSWLPQVYRLLGERLDYNWTLAYLTPGQSAKVWARRTSTFWKPVLWLSKGRYQGDWVGDVCRSDGNDKAHHHWGQSVSGMLDLVRRFADPGDVVCDPFLGGGTTAIAARLCGCRFIGLDLDERCLQTTRQRLNELREEAPNE
ncbi:MAG: DNA methyltransferase [Planctomycetota bacterium]